MNRKVSTWFILNIILLSIIYVAISTLVFDEKFSIQTVVIALLVSFFITTTSHFSKEAFKKEK